MTYGESMRGASTEAGVGLNGVREADSILVAAISDGDTLQEELYVRYRRSLYQIFLQRRVKADVAQDLVQRTFLQAIKKIRSEGLTEPARLGGYLYRTACNLATLHWRGELLRREDSAEDERIDDITDEALSLEERIDHEMLARSVRDLMTQLRGPRDREVLMRFYLHEEPKASVCRNMALSDLQFNQVLWRARQRFGAILRRNGVSRTR
ncbi:MAG: RNA polymerase sigma factor [Steroidobacteraceae bacterium]